MSLRAAIVLAGLALFAGGAAAQTSATSAFTFSPADYSSDAGARGIVSDDFDNDGSPDFATANAGTNTVDVFMNREFTGGGFQVKRYAVGAGPFDITSADFNYDNYPDLVVAAADANEIDVLFGDVGGNFKAPMRIPVSGNPRGVAAGYLGVSGYSIVYSSYTSGTISFLDYDYSSGTFLRGITLNAGANPQGIVVGYLKPIGCGPDIAVANAGGSPITLLQRNCDGTFTRAELTAPVGSGGTNMNVLVAADFNKDNRLDLAAASTSASYVAIYLNSTTGLHWTANLGGGTVSSPRGIAAADLNLDGRQDLIVASRTSSSVTIFTAGNSASVFSTHQIVKSASGSRTVAAADFDGDGRVDLATGNEYASSGTVLWNRTPGRGGPGATAFELRAMPDNTADGWAAGGPFAVADFNHNGIPDIVVGDGLVLDATTPVKIDAGRQFPWVSSAIVGDFNDDGHNDFAQATYYYVSLDPWKLARSLDFMMGDGAGHFTLGTSLPFTALWGMVTADFNRDGHTDVVVLDNTGAGSFVRKVFLGRGDGTFAETDQTSRVYEYIRAAADFNGDGNVDLLVSDSSQQVRIYLGDGSGAFPSETTAPSVGYIYGLRAGDFNGDGVADLVASRSGNTLVTWLGRGDATFAAPVFSDLPWASYDLAVADFTGDGRPDVLTGEGTLAVGNGDGTFGTNRQINVSFVDAVIADIDRDGLPDLFIGTYYYTAMALYNRSAEQPNAAPIAKVWPHDMTVPFTSQFQEDGLTVTATKSYDPNLDPLSFTWLENEQVIATGDTLYVNMPAGTHTVTLVVRDNAGAEVRDTATITIQPYEEIVMHAGWNAGAAGSWIQQEDATAADSRTAWHPNANATKPAAPLANPTNYLELWFPADSSQDYKLWIRLKAQDNSPYNDSVFVQFDGAVNSSGAPVDQIGTTSALSVNLEECSGCGLSGWGWRDEAWGSRGAAGAQTLRFPRGKYGAWQRMRIQTREDGVMIDQIVLSSVKYKTTRPGAVKNDTTILWSTVPED
jgi:FG-GAP-like repeat